MITITVPRVAAVAGHHCDATMSRRPGRTATARIVWGRDEWAYRETPRGVEATVPHETRRVLLEHGSAYLGNVLLTGVVLRLGR